MQLEITYKKYYKFLKKKTHEKKLLLNKSILIIQAKSP
jgi:hypothetical protein